MLVIASRMSAALRRLHTPEDILQEGLMHAWRDRARCQWRGVRNFRSWLLTIIDNRICEAADREGAEKRGSGRGPIRLAELPRDAECGGGRERGSGDWGPAGSTTPSRIAIYREQCAAMQAALVSLPDDVREVVRLRLYEQLAMEEVAARLGLGLSAAWRRFRKGAELYHQLLTAEFTSRSLPLREATFSGKDSSS